MVLDKSLIGKKVKVHLPKKYYRGSGITVEASYIVGTCTFAGYNSILETMQITVDRMPIFPIRGNDIELCI